MTLPLTISYLDKLAIKSPVFSGRVAFVDHLNEQILEYPWSPSIFSDAGTRKNENFYGSQVLAYDIDNYPEQKQLRLDEAKTIYEKFNVLIGTTRNHQTLKNKKYPAADRYRLIFVLDKPITSAETYKSHWKYYKEKLGLNGVADEATKDPARYFFPCKEIILNQIYDTTKEPLKQMGDNFSFYMPVGRPKKDEKKVLLAGVKGKLNSKTLSFLAQIPDERGWHDSFIAAAINMKAQGYTQAEAEVELTKASPEGELDRTDLKQLEDVYLNDRGEPAPVVIPWPHVVYKENKDGEPITIPVKNSARNSEYLIKVVQGLNLRYNTRMKIIEKRPGEYLSDSDVDEMFVISNENNLGITKELLNAHLNVIAEKNSYDPLKSSIENEKWDGKSRFNELLATLDFPEEVTPEDLKLYEMFLRKWLIGVVTRIYTPGSENNMLVFVGAQGAGKTRWFRRLAQPYPQGFIEAHINTDDKDSHLNLLKYFIWSVSELDTVTWSKDVGALKDFITKSEVRVRPAYGRREEIGSAITSFCASVNSRDFLHDTTGNRRYLILLVESVNADHKVNIGQVFAEAKVLMEQGERAWFSREEIDSVNLYNERFISRSDILESFEARVSAGEKPLSLKEIAEQLQLGDLKNSDRRSIRDWMTKKKIKEVNHSNVKKYYVTISPSLQLGAARPTSATKIVGGINRIDMLRGPSKKDGIKQ